MYKVWTWEKDREFRGDAAYVDERNGSGMGILPSGSSPIPSEFRKKQQKLKGIFIWSWVKTHVTGNDSYCDDSYLGYDSQVWLILCVVRIDSGD